MARDLEGVRADGIRLTDVEATEPRGQHAEQRILLMATGASRGTAFALSLMVLATASCGIGSGRDPIDAASDFLEGRPLPEVADVAERATQFEDVNELAKASGSGSICGLFKPTAYWVPKLTEEMEDRFDGHESLEHPVDFPDQPAHVGPACLWEQKLDRFVRNQVSLIVMPLEEFDVVRGQAGQPVDLTTLPFVPQPSLEVHFDPTDDPPASIPDPANGRRVWHRGTVSLDWRREAGAPWARNLDTKELKEVDAVPFPGVAIIVTVNGEITMLPDEDIKLRLMHIAEAAEGILIFLHELATGGHLGRAFGGYSHVGERVLEFHR